ncbi:PMS1 protein homolog 1 isoform X2 [Harpegnathos saltator]|uniref:PMS1 protein homolog 1 isoform X2 n=1 Tax=Harpegnathos saltator TaxID=610380 RepID=UPI00058D2C39|nr:PMS1 protein homolog 1 isoform X2 [Harpegnathos saltator]
MQHVCRINKSEKYKNIKELIENALDANADNIEINLIDNGTSLIEVKDNGCGISKDDALFMGLSSYTSKISNFEDLDVLYTFGFRGEALNALCAVAEVTIITKTMEDIAGTSYTMDHDGQIIKYEPCHRSTGTTVQAKNLFKQLPVRRQMIINTRRANQNIKLLETLIQSFSICKPNIRIQFRIDNNVIFAKPSLNNIKEAACHVLGRKITSNMEWIEPKNIGFVLQLMLPSKQVKDLSEITHSGLQYIFVNNRSIKHKELEKVVINTILEYFEQESCRKKVVFLVYIVLEPINIDVNLEPNKDTILFKDQNKVLDTIDKCIRTFYGLKFLRIAEQNVSDDASSCYEDCILNTNEGIIENEWSACKKRKIHAQENMQEDIIKEKIIPKHHNAVINECEEALQNKQQGVNQTYNQQHYKDALILATHIQAPNLSDSDSNDIFPIPSSSNNSISVQEERETLSQLPIVDLGEDFDFVDENIETKNLSILTNENQNNWNKLQKKKQISLETWSKGHIPGLKSGIDVNSAFAVGNQLSENFAKENNEILESNKTHVDHKELKFLKHVRSQVVKENPTLTAPQTAKKITEFWKQLSSEERGYYRDIAEEEDEYKECKKIEKKTEANKIDSERNKNRLLKLFEKINNKKNEKKENLKIRTIVPWIIDRDRITIRSNFENNHIIGRLTSNLWIATICEQIWIIDITSLIKGLKITNIDINKVDAKKIEELLKQWLLKRDDMSVMRSIYEFTKNI